MIAAMLELLKPAPSDVIALAKREADPRFVAEFEPLHLGLAGSIAMLVAIGVAGGIMAPFRALARRRGRAP